MKNGGLNSLGAGAGCAVTALLVSVARLVRLSSRRRRGELTLRLCNAALVRESARGLACFQPRPSTGGSGSERKPWRESERDQPEAGFARAARSKVTSPKKGERYLAGGCGRVSPL